MTATKILPHERKFVKMVQLMDKIVTSDLESTIDSMIEKDPRMLCRLNLRNKKVADILNKKIKEGSLHPFDLMHEPEETLELVGISRTEAGKNFPLAPEDAGWLKTFEADFEEKTRKIKWAKKPNRKARRLDESHDDMMALV